jgi:serine/threonine-protein kinase
MTEPTDPRPERSNDSSDSVATRIMTPAPEARAADSVATRVMSPAPEARAASPAPASTSAPSSLPLSESGAPVAEGEVLADKYKVESVLGRGGVGVVVAATHIRLKQKVAIKFVLPGTPEELVERFLREAQSAVKLKSEHVAKVLDVGELPNGSPYMVMEFLEGSDLAEHLTWQGPLPIAEAVEYMLQACEAMAEAHAAGIIHRDLKPANLFLTASGGMKLIKVLDFGISKNIEDPVGGRAGMSLTKTAAVFGSPLYMPPEQMRSAREVDARSDIWSLGVILYEILTGQPPFDAELYPDLVVKISMAPAKPPSMLRREIPAKLDQVILRCLEKKPADRFQSVGELAAALAPFAPPHARGSAERIQRMQEAQGDRWSGQLAARGSAAAAARTEANLRSEGEKKLPPGLVWKVVAVSVVLTTALVLGAAMLLRGKKGQEDGARGSDIAAATEPTAAPGGQGAAGKMDPQVSVTPAGAASGAPEGPPQGSAAPQANATSAPQPKAPAGQPARTAQPPAQAVTQAAPPAATPPPAPTKKNPLDMDLR